MRNFSDLKSLVFVSVFAIVLMSCKSYKIQDQRDPSLSLLIIKTNIPDGYAIQDSSVKNKAGNTYKSVFFADQSDNRINKVIILDNIDKGDYRMAYLHAETRRSSTSTRVGNTVHTRSTWNVLDLKFGNDDKNSNNGIWLNVPSSAIVYAGDIAWFQNSMKEKVLDKMSEIYKKPKKVIEKCILYNFNMITSKGTEPYFLIRLDHPSLIGEKESLKSEVRMLIAFKASKKSKNKNWDIMIDQRINALIQKLEAMKDK